MVRDMVRHLQVLRKDAGLSVSQRIELSLTTESASLREAISEHRSYIMNELLAVRLEEMPLEPPKAELRVVVEDQPVFATLTW